MIKFEDLQKANESIKTTDIKGKNYAEVNQRVKAFRMVYPTGGINTKIEQIADGVCIITAEVGFWEDDKYYILGTGTAYEKENSTFINKTSYIENCETSAVGRALGFAGFGIDTSIASVEEVQTAMANQEEKKVTPLRCTPAQLKILSEVYTGAKLDKLLALNNISKIEDLSLTKASELISKLNK